MKQISNLHPSQLVVCHQCEFYQQIFCCPKPSQLPKVCSGQNKLSWEKTTVWDTGTNCALTRTASCASTSVLLQTRLRLSTAPWKQQLPKGDRNPRQENLTRVEGGPGRKRL